MCIQWTPLFGPLCAERNSTLMFSRRQATACLLAGVIAIAITSQPAFSQTLTWKQLSLTTSPPPRMYPAMAYDAVSKKLVLFGGLGANGNLNDTWAFDGNTWTQLDAPVAPPVRNGASMAFDLSTNKLVMFGGFDVNQFLQDTWVWDGASSTWTEARMPSPPPPGHRSNVVYRSAHGQSHHVRRV